MNTSCFVNGIEVIVFDANHCPGSCMFMFIVGPSEIYLHTGDFRASPACGNLWKRLEPYRAKIAKLFLDSTYLKPEYSFPPQHQIINKVGLCGVMTNLMWIRNLPSEFVFMGPLLTLQGGSAACSVLTPDFLCYFFHLPLPTRPLCTRDTNKLKNKLVVSIRAVPFNRNN